MESPSVLDKVITLINDSAQLNSHSFLSAQEKTAREFQECIKSLYDFSTNINTTYNIKNNVLPEIIIQDFDEEQIWQQLDIENQSKLTHFLIKVSRLLTANNMEILPLNSLNLNGNSENKTPIKYSSRHIDEDMDISDDDADISDDDIPKLNKYEKYQKISSMIKEKSSLCDDKFFKLHELEAYLINEEKKEFKNQHCNKFDKSEEDNSINYFEDDFDEASDNADNDNSEDGRMLKYADFFNNPAEIDEFHKYKNSDEPNDSDDDNFKSQDNINDTHENTLHENTSSTSQVVDFHHNESDEENNTIKSTFEIRQKRLQKTMKELESDVVTECKPWQLRGEVSAANRPQNSLLEEYVEFDVTTRPAPITTEETMLKLEDIIKQRIKDKSFDNVEKKFKPSETPLEYKKKLVMDQEKSKKSLSQIYEDAYVTHRDKVLNELDDNQETESKEEIKEHKEIRNQLHSLFHKLDALSNYHYTPKVIQPEIKIISNVPALTMEDVAPVAVAESVLLAPEEIQVGGVRSDLIGKSERTKTDIKRQRRKKKVQQRKHFKSKANIDSALDNNLKKKNKHQIKTTQDVLLKKLTSNRNIKKVDDANYTVPKSSTAFFAQLQNEVKGLVKSKTKSNISKIKKNVNSALKYKL